MPAPPIIRKHKRLSLWLGALFLVCFPAGPAQAETLIRIGGSTTVLPVVTRAAEVFRAAHPELRLTVKAGGSGVGVQGTGTGRLDIGMVSRELTPEEQNRFRDQDLRLWVIGRDAVACVVSSPVYEAGVTALSRGQIRAIYDGSLRNWKEVGGPDRPILVIDKERHRGTRQVFMKYVYGDPLARAPGAHLVTGSNNEEQAKVGRSRAAIGMLSFAWVNPRVRALALRDQGRLIRPTPANVANGSYPIARNLNLLTRGRPRGAVAAFIEFLLGPEGQRLVREAGYLPVRPEEGSHLTRKLPSPH